MIPQLPSHYTKSRAKQLSDLTLNNPSRLGGVVVSVLATEHNCRGLKPGRGDGFLRAIKIRSTPLFGLEVKPGVPCRKMVQKEAAVA
jgi:hypothetical protein